MGSRHDCHHRRGKCKDAEGRIGAATCRRDRSGQGPVCCTDIRIPSGSLPCEFPKPADLGQSMPPTPPGGPPHHQSMSSDSQHQQKRIRDAVYDLAAGTAEDWQVPHADHCIDYVRQAIMCHGELTPIYFEWRDDHRSYRAEQSNIHQCRSWDAIFQWSEARNKTHLRIDGKHGRKGEKGD